MSAIRRPLVLIPQHFGCLVFERHTSRYLPFDHEATELLLALHREPLHAVLAQLESDAECETVLGFFDSFYQRGFFDLQGRLAADVLDVDVPEGHLVGPLAVHLEIIGACNLTCTHCFAGELPRNHDPLRVSEMENLFDDLARLGSFRLGLTGGEPLLRKDLFDILDAATERGLHPCLTTNGLLLTDDIARELGRRRFIWLNVSLEGPDAATNDCVRGAGTFDVVLKKLAILRRHARFTLAFTILRTNAHLVQQCAELAYRVGAHTAVFRPLYPVGVALDHLDLMPTFGQYTRALNELAELPLLGEDLHGLDPFSPTTQSSSEPEIHTSHTCGAGQHLCSISVQGDVNPCSFLGPGFNAGNIRTTPFPVIWHSAQEFERMRRDAGPDGFQGGCRARAQVFAGSVDAPDPWYEEFCQHESGVALAPGANVEVAARPRAANSLLSLPLVSS
jgi:radical SAM protein with 4Fe4S-binding SPASM domain